MKALRERLDYDALWRLALREAREQIELLYPPEVTRERAIQEKALALKYFRQMAYGRRP
jgi:hypothetical protein